MKPLLQNLSIVQYISEEITKRKLELFVFLVWPVSKGKSTGREHVYPVFIFKGKSCPQGIIVLLCSLAYLPGIKGRFTIFTDTGTTIVPRADSTHTPPAQMLHLMVSKVFWSSLLIRVCLLFHVT